MSEERYACGNVPQVGDVVTVVDATECTGVYVGEQYTVSEVDSLYGGVWLADKSFASGFMCFRFRLLHRAGVTDKDPHGMYAAEPSELIALRAENAELRKRAELAEAEAAKWQERCKRLDEFYTPEVNGLIVAARKYADAFNRSMMGSPTPTVAGRVV